MMHLFHRWETIKDTRETQYQRCSVCGKRRVTQWGGGYQPIDYYWLETGEWQVMTVPAGDTAVTRQAVRGGAGCRLSVSARPESLR